MNSRSETRTVEHRRTRPLLLALAVVGLLAVVLGRCREATSPLPAVAIRRTRPPVELDMATIPPPSVTPRTSAPTPPTTTHPAPPPRPSPGCASSTSSAAAGTSDVALISGGRPRRYLRTLPAGSGSAPTPLVVVLDDGSGDPGAFLDRARWTEAAQPGPLAVIAPRWTRPDDDQLTAEAIVDTERSACVDLARVYLAGYSTGANLGTRVVCDHPGLVTAFVAVAGLLPPDGCPAGARVPVLAVQGVLDETVSASSVVDATQRWAQQDGCRPEPMSETVGWNVEYSEFQECDDAVDVQLDLVLDMGHEWPERTDDLGAARRWADLMSTSTTAMMFFETNAR